LIPLLSPILLTLAIADLKLSVIFLAAVSMLPSRVRVIPRYLNSVKALSVRSTKYQKAAFLDKLFNKNPELHAMLRQTSA
jgi:DNA polymerase III psi subunit